MYMTLFAIVYQEEPPCRYTIVNDINNAEEVLDKLIELWHSCFEYVNIDQLKSLSKNYIIAKDNISNKDNIINTDNIIKENNIEPKEEICSKSTYEKYLKELSVKRNKKKINSNNNQLNLFQ